MIRRRSPRRRAGSRRPRRLAVLLAGLAILALLYAAFEAGIAREFERRSAEVPTRVYARPIVLRPGERIDPAWLRSHLERAGYQRAAARSGRVSRGRYRERGGEWRIGRRALRLGRAFDPGGEISFALDRGGVVRALRSGDGVRLDRVLLEPERIGSVWGARRRDRIPVRLGELPTHLIEALLTVEDRRFHEHAGVDPRRVLGALLANLREGRIAQGGSTLTQQLARTLFLTPDRSLARKLHETAIAFALERRYPKARLLEAYLNHIYLGQDGAIAIHGVGSAAEHYFGKDATELDLGESALLAGIIRGPSAYSPFRHPDAARARRDLVLALMERRGAIDAETRRLAAAGPLGLRSGGPRSPRPRYFLDHVLEELRAARPRSDLGTAGLSVVSTLDPRLQAAAERAVRDGLARLDAAGRRAGRPAVAQAALVALEPASGAILAMVGGRDYGASQFNRATHARRQPGSAFKPVVALAAVAAGDGARGGPRFTLASRVEDAPLTVSTPAGVWRPDNADRAFVGPVTLRRALEESRNVPFARIGVAVGPERLVRTARSLGVKSPLAPVPSLALGASEVTPLEITAAYGVLATGGVRAPVHAIHAALGRAGERLDPGREPPVRAFDPAEAYLVTSALRGAVERGTGRGVRALGFHGPVAGKSGTTNGTRDAWFVGYTPEMAVGVWVGHDDGAPLGLSGSRAALPIFARFLVSALGPEGGAPFRIPEALEIVEIDPRTGLRGGWGCRGEPELFLPGTAPERSCGVAWPIPIGRPGPDRRLGRSGRVALEEAERWLRHRLRDLQRRVARIESGGR